MTFKQFVRFTNDASGIEKILRILQSFCQIVAAYVLTAEDALIWWDLRAKFALGRRYIRFFRFLENFSKVYELIYTGQDLRTLLLIGKWGFMGLYLGCESLTVLDAVGFWTTPKWTERCILEGNRFWFYSLVCSILIGLMTLAQPAQARKPAVESDRKNGIAKVEIKKKVQGTKRKLVGDCFDLLSPGNITGWIPTSVAVVGYSSVVSTVLSSKDIFDRLR